MPSPAMIENQYSLGWIGVPRIFFIVSLRANPPSTGIVFKMQDAGNEEFLDPKARVGGSARVLGAE